MVHWIDLRDSLLGNLHILWEKKTWIQPIEWLYGYNFIPLILTPPKWSKGVEIP